jgi:Periplasmic binding protein
MLKRMISCRIVLAGMLSMLTFLGRGAEPLKIGMVAPVTGALAELGRYQIQGAKLAVEEINKAGGLLDRPIELVICIKEFNMDTIDTPKRPFPIVPTTKILATGRFTSPPTPEQLEAIFPKEVPATLKLYLAGKIDQWWARQDQKGPVFLMNVTTIEEAKTLLDALPLGQAKLMEFEFTELSPLTPLHMLIKEA